MIQLEPIWEFIDFVDLFTPYTRAIHKVVKISIQVNLWISGFQLFLATFMELDCNRNRKWFLMVMEFWVWKTSKTGIKKGIMKSQNGLNSPEVYIRSKFDHFVHFDNILIILIFSFPIFCRHVRLNLILSICSHGWKWFRRLCMPLNDFTVRIAIYFRDWKIYLRRFSFLQKYRNVRVIRMIEINKKLFGLEPSCRS